MALDFLKKLVLNWAGAKAAMPLTQLRRGMWVFVAIDDKERGVVFEGVGILNSIHPTGECEIHLVDDQGGTLRSITVAPQWLMQAGLDQIPEARRPSRAVAETYGYK